MSECICGWTDTEENERHSVDRNGSRWKKWRNGWMESRGVKRWVGKWDARTLPCTCRQGGGAAGWVGRRMDDLERMDGWMDGWMEGQVNRWVVSRKEWLSRGRIGRWENTSPNA